MVGDTRTECNEGLKFCDVIFWQGTYNRCADGLSRGQKGLVDKLADSGLLAENHLIRTTEFVTQDEADIEDVIGRTLYRERVNRCYDLSGSHALPAERASDAPNRVVKETELHFRGLPATFEEFTHGRPAEYLLRQTHDAFPEALLAEAEERFRNCFARLNELLN